MSSQMDVLRPRILSLTFSRSFLVFFCRFLHLLQVGVRVLHKRLLAPRLINFYFLSFVDEGYWVRSERLSIHNAIVQWIWLCGIRRKYSRTGGRHQPE